MSESCSICAGNCPTVSRAHAAVVTALAVGLASSVPLGHLGQRRPARPLEVILAGTGILQTIPSLACWP